MSEKGWVLVTGASAGIGFELAKIFADNGYKLALAAKTLDRLKKAAEELRARTTHVEVFVTDLASPGSASTLYEQVKARGLNVEILVNNAGFGDFGKFLDTDDSKDAQMMQLNMVSLVELTKYFLRDFKKKGKGRVLNLASTAAFQPGPLMAIYYASKAFVLNFSEAVNHELKGTGITVTALCPGPTQSNFQKTAQMESSRLVKSGLMDPHTVALKGYRALMAGKSFVIPGFRNKMLATSVRFFPRDLVTTISKKAVEATV